MLQEERAPQLAFVEARIGGKNVTALVDGGSGATLIKRDILTSIGHSFTAGTTVPLQGVTGRKLETLGQAEVSTNLSGVTLPLKCIVTTEDLPADVLIGKDEMKRHKIYDKNDYVEVDKKKIDLIQRAAEEVLSIVLPAGKQVPAHGSRVFRVDMRGRVKDAASYVVEGKMKGSLCEERFLTVTPTCQLARDGHLDVEVHNHGSEDFVLPDETLIACATRADEHTLSTDRAAIAAVVRKAFGGKQQRKKANVERSSLQEVLESHPALKKMKRVGELSACGERRLAKILYRYRDRFSQDGDEFLMSPAKVSPLQVFPKEGAVPKFQRPYLLPQSKKEVAKRYLQEMLDKKVIRPGISAWGSPLVLVKKKDGTTRVCVDLRYPNGQVSAMYSNLPNIDYVLGSQLNTENARFLTALDLSSFYHQIPLDDKHGMLNLSSHLGSFQFVRVPMGFVSSSGYVQSLMLTLLSDVVDSSVVVLIDDLLCHTATESEHLDLLELILGRFEEVNFVLKPSKCELVVPSVDYLGFVINGAEAKLQLQEQKIGKVRDWPRPKTVTDIKSFIGFCSYVRRFVVGFSKIAKPLMELTRGADGNIQRDWTPECEQSFQNLKRAITASPTLQLPDPNKRFHVYCDASEAALGYVVMQKADLPNGKSALAPVAYGSRRVTETEGRYIIAELEALAVSFALFKLRFMIQGKDFVVYTDSDAVKWSLKADANSRSKRLARFMMNIQDVLPASGQLEVRHVRGEINPADPLSRVAFGPNDESDAQHVEKVAEVQSIYAVLRSDTKADGRLKAIRDAQANDVEMRQLRKELAKKDVFKRGQKLALRDGVIVSLKEDGGFRYLLPPEMAKELVRERHYDPMESHPSENELVTYFSQRFVIPKLTEIANNVANTCDVCQRTRLSKRHFIANMANIPRASQPMECMSLDVAGPYLGYGNSTKYILVAMCNFSRYAFTKAVGRQTGKEVADFLMEIFLTYGVPKSLLSDRGVNLKFGIVPALMERMGVKKIETTSYHPQSNGLAERLIGTIGRALKRLVLAEKDASKWPEILKTCVSAYNRRVHSATGYAPAEVLFGYVPETGHEPVPARVPIIRQHEDFVAEKMERRQKILQDVQKHLEEAEAKRKEVFDRTRARPHDFKAGRWVLVRVGHKTGGKLRVPYFGPARIDEVDAHTAKVTFISNGVEERINIERLKHYLTSEKLEVENFTAPRRNVGIRVQTTDDTVDDVEYGLTDDSVVDESVSFA